MPTTLYNTLTRHLDVFTPIVDDTVTLYTCGPTVYDYLHVGNWAAYIYWDALVRMLRSSGYSVNRVMNITDVGHLVSDADDGEDKLEKGARRDGKTAWEIAEFYAEDFQRGIAALNLIQPDHLVRATDYIPQQLEMVRTLKAKGYTYQTTDGIYYDTSKFPTYADFAHLDLAAQKAGARVEANDEKRQPWDFALWKFTEPGKVRDMEWETPVDLFDTAPSSETPVMGFPGWHLECSTMAMCLLGETIDIHTGGIDHIPVHHTNEIAQSEAVTGKPFAHYWLHNNHLKIEGSKVSKSLGNGVTLQDISAKGFTPMDLKLFVLQSRFTSEGNFTFENLAAAHNRLENWRRYAVLRHQVHDVLVDDDDRNRGGKFISLEAGSGAIREAMQNNLNSPEALRIIDETFARLDNRPLTIIHRFGLVDFIDTIDELFGLQLASSTPDITDEAKRIIVERQRARDMKQWQSSDKLRDTLLSQGIVVDDTASSTVWHYQSQSKNPQA